MIVILSSQRDKPGPSASQALRELRDQTFIAVQVATAIAGIEDGEDLANNN